MSHVVVRDDLVEIDRKEYERLKRRSRKLAALERGGVDNWEWYGEAISSLNEEDDEDD